MKFGPEWMFDGEITLTGVRVMTVLNSISEFYETDSVLITQEELSLIIGCSRMSINSSIKMLEKRGFVRRCRDRISGHSFYLLPSDKMGSFECKADFTCKADLTPQDSSLQTHPQDSQSIDLKSIDLVSRALSPHTVPPMKVEPPTPFEILALPFPDELVILPGFPEIWTEWVEYKQERCADKKNNRVPWKSIEASSSALKKCVNKHLQGRDVVKVISESLEREWVGIGWAFVQEGGEGSNTGPSKNQVSDLDAQMVELMKRDVPPSHSLN